MSSGGDSATHGAAATTSKNVAPVSRTVFNTSDSASAVIWAPVQNDQIAPSVDQRRIASSAELQAAETIPPVLVAATPGSVHRLRPAREFFSDARASDPDARSFAFATT